MKSHFIFNENILPYAGCIELIQDILKNNFQVFIISTNSTTNELWSCLPVQFQQYPLLCLLGNDKINNLLAGYQIACADLSEMKHLGIVFENSLEGIKAANKLGLYVIALEHHSSAVAADVEGDSIAEIFEELKISEIYQLQYLPQLKFIKTKLKNKMGYPSSFYQALRGKYTDSGVVIDEQSPKLIDDAFFYQESNRIDILINNVGDPFTFSKTWRIDTRMFEQDILKVMGKYYGLTEDRARGYITAGGTESNFAALWWARDNLVKNLIATRQEIIDEHIPVALFYSTATHYSIPKIAAQLVLKKCPIPTTAEGKIDIACFHEAICSHMTLTPHIPLIINANAGTTQTGAIDDIPSMKKILDEEVKAKGNDYFIHLDAASIGAVLPLLQPFGPQITNYFDDLGISTIAISAHKFFGSITVCGILLTTKEFLEKSTAHLDLDIYYNSGALDITFGGSRCGHNVLYLHNTLYSLDMHTDQARLKKMLAQCRINNEYLYQQLITIVDKKQVIRLPFSFNIVFPKPSDATTEKYSLMPINKDQCGISSLMHVNKPLIDQFIEEYRADLQRNDL